MGVPTAHLCLCPLAGHWELVNPWCSLVTLTAHLKRKGQVPPDGKEMDRGQGRRG